VSIAVTARSGDFTQEAEQSVSISSRLTATFQTDKPIYQPGQVLHLRALVLNAEGSAAAGETFSLRIADDQGDRVHTVDLVSSKFGIVQHDWPLPATASLGAYQLVLRTKGGDEYHVGRHTIRVSRYELPTFRVTAQPEFTSYLPAQPVRVTVTGSYLFGKPVPKGQVKIVRNSSTVKGESNDEVVVEGRAGEDGSFTASLDLNDAIPEGQRFRDLHFAAYYRDPASGRTEQRRFDVRLTREPIHVYLIRSRSDFYVATAYADGRPAPAAVEVHYCGSTTSLQTNRFGVGKALLKRGELCEPSVDVKAADAAGLTGKSNEHYWSNDSVPYQLETQRTLHRLGEAVTLTVTGPAHLPANQFVMVDALIDGARVASRMVQLRNHRGEIAFPFQPEFRRVVVFAAWSAVQPDSGGGEPGAKAVIFPDSSDLKITATTAQATYRPGDKASLRMRVTSAAGQPVSAALGLAVVDQAVLERARTDGEFGSRPWFDCAFCQDEGEAEIGGVRLNDLFALKPASPLSADLDLVAEALVASASAQIRRQRSESVSAPPIFSRMATQMKEASALLEARYARTLEFPEDLPSLTGVLPWSRFNDPWDKPYEADFTVERDARVITLRSSGPDKRFGTPDDFIAGVFRRAYFKPLQQMIAQMLKTLEDYPATSADFARLLSDNGLLLASLRDPWGTAYQASVGTVNATRVIYIASAGPDRTFGTPDDVDLAYFSGSYFRAQGRVILRALDDANPAPRTLDDFRAALARAGIDAEANRDAWGRPYRLTVAVSSQYTDRVTARTIQVFGGALGTQQDVVPVTRKFVTFSLRSDGPDGVQGNHDDFDVARFPILLNEESAAPAASAPPNAMPPVRGTGSVMGVVADPAGGVIPDATVILLDAAQTPHETVSGPEGIFLFAGLPPGVYTLKVSAPGFMAFEMSLVPVTANRTTRADVELRVATVAQTVAVEAGVEPVQTSQSSMLASVPSTTPRPRTYFPETLLWLPEIPTDAAGRATTELTLADSVTTWKVALFASTVDGRTAQSETDLRAFQPFFLEFNPPAVLTQGDRVELPVIIRNYQPRDHQVTVSLAPGTALAIEGSPLRKVSVASNGAATAAFVVQANASVGELRPRITAEAGRAGRDAVEKTLRVHPDGQQVAQSFAGLAMGEIAFNISIPSAAVPGATSGELRLYPNLASLLLESSAAILQTPHGCAEQTISAAFANLIAWQFARTAGVNDPRIEQRALGNVRLAISSLSGLQDSGGIPYWRAGEPDIAVTAHALHFIAAASGAAAIDLADWSPMVTWLEQSQEKDGRWLGRDGKGSLLLTALVTRSLSAALQAGMKVSSSTLAAAYHHLARFTDRTPEPYLLAQFILAALDSGDEKLLGDTVARLASLAHEERGALYWDLQTNSPFFGWGTAGRHETTGLAVSALSRWRGAHPAATDLDAPIRRGAAFLLSGRGGSGDWSSTQATLLAMRALTDASAVLSRPGGAGGGIEVRAGGRTIQTVTLPSDPHATDPISLDVSRILAPGDHQITLVPSAGAAGVLARLTATHWLPWDRAAIRQSPELRLAVQFDRLKVPVGAPVQCRVKAERVGFRGYGMMLAEIGLPPGAEVDRASLEAVLTEAKAGVDHYELLPDRVILYLWPQAGGAEFSFLLSARAAMTAKSGPSVLYDYYNPEALAEVIPSTWVVKP
jgi:hypothetical protein